MNLWKLIPYLVFNFVPKLEIAPLVIGGLIGAGASLVGQGINFFSQKKANDANIAAQNANLDYQKAVQQQTWQREDTAWQRAVQDIQKTGMSPLALSGGAGAGQVVSTTATQGQAPQIDAGAVANSAANVTAAIQADKQLKLQTKQMENTVKQQEIENKMKQAEFEQMKLQFDKDYNLRAAGQEEGFKLDWSRLARDLANDTEQTRQFEKRLSHDDAVRAFNEYMFEKEFAETIKNNESNRRKINADSWKQEYENERLKNTGSGLNYDPFALVTGAGYTIGKKIGTGIQKYVYGKKVDKEFERSGLSSGRHR